MNLKKDHPDLWKLLTSLYMAACNSERAPSNDALEDFSKLHHLYLSHEYQGYPRRGLPDALYTLRQAGYLEVQISGRNYRVFRVRLELSEDFKSTAPHPQNNRPHLILTAKGTLKPQSSPFRDIPLDRSELISLIREDR